MKIQSSKGFTLLEVLIILGIIAILSLMFTPGFERTIITNRWNTAHKAENSSITKDEVSVLIQYGFEKNNIIRMSKYEIDSILKMTSTNKKEKSISSIVLSSPVVSSVNN